MIRVEFAGNRIGRRHDQDPVDLDVADLDALADAVLTHCRRHLMSRDVDLVLDPGDETHAHGTGLVLCGLVHVGARFRFHTLPGGTP